PLMQTLMPDLRARNLFFIDSRTTAATVAYVTAEQDGVPAASRKVFLDATPTKEAVLAQLELAAKDAARDGSAVAIGHPHPVTIAALAQESPTLESRGIRLVFASDLAHLCRFDYWLAKAKHELDPGTIQETDWLNNPKVGGAGDSRDSKARSAVTGLNFSPDGLDDVRAADVLVRCYQGETLGERRCGDDTVGGVLGEGCGQGDGLRAHPAVHRQDHKLRFHLLQERFHADVQFDSAPASESGQLQKRHVRDCQPLRVFAHLIDRGPGLPRDSFLSERQPDDNVRIGQNHFRSPHSSKEKAG